MKPENIVSVIFITLFLLFAYFMIGGYTPCGEYRYYENHDISPKNHTRPILDFSHVYRPVNSYVNRPEDTYTSKHIDNSDALFNKSIYEYGPYLNV